MTPLLPHCASMDSTVASLCLNGLHCGLSGKPLMTPLWPLWKTSNDTTVVPLCPHWPHCGSTVSPLTSLWLQWTPLWLHCGSNGLHCDSTVTPMWPQWTPMWPQCGLNVAKMDPNVAKMDPNMAKMSKIITFLSPKWPKCRKLSLFWVQNGQNGQTVSSGLPGPVPRGGCKVRTVSRYHHYPGYHHCTTTVDHVLHPGTPLCQQARHRSPGFFAIRGPSQNTTLSKTTVFDESKPDLSKLSFLSKIPT